MSTLLILVIAIVAMVLVGAVLVLCAISEDVMRETMTDKERAKDRAAQMRAQDQFRQSGVDQ